MCERIFYVYQLRLSNSTMPFYVGKGKARRAWDHFKAHSLRECTHKNNTVKKAVREGVEILVEMILVNLLNSEALAWEVWAIAAYGRSRDGGCLTNLTSGGEGAVGYEHTEKSKAKMRISSTGRVATAETRAKISAAHKGKVVSEETRRKSSETKLSQGIKYTDAQKEAMSALLTGRVTSQETKARMSAAMTGLKRSDEGRENMRIANQALPKTKCPHCNVWAVKRQLSRYHNERCKALVG